MHYIVFFLLILGLIEQRETSVTAMMFMMFASVFPLCSRIRKNLYFGDSSSKSNNNFGTRMDLPCGGLHYLFSNRCQMSTDLESLKWL